MSQESYILFNLLWADPVETEDDKEEDGRGDQFTTDQGAFVIQMCTEIFFSFIQSETCSGMK